MDWWTCLCSLVSVIDSATGLLNDLKTFNSEHWTIHYPTQLGVGAPTKNASVPSTPIRGPTRSNSVADLETVQTSEESSPRPALPQRSFSTHETPSKSVTSPEKHPLSILSLDLKLGAHAPSPSSLPALLPSLSMQTLSQLLSRRLTSSLTHLGSLRSRVLDTSSRILVTGDLNAGKSTFVNALLKKRDLMPVDQQPLTEVFCEILDAKTYNEGKEELHALREATIEVYDRTKEETFARFKLEDLEEVVTQGEEYAIIKVYVNDVQGGEGAESEDSLIGNNLVSISLIDAPGLNRDTLSTTAVFARQTEIDVIVFVVSAENHLTLSAKEFLFNASREKAYVFVVVNKWGGIRDKNRCRRIVGEQIKQLSPATWDARSELVHFVDSASALPKEDEEEVDDDVDFEHLKMSLKSFVLLKRAKSKLAPAKHYLLNLLSDLSTLGSVNLSAASAELEEALEQLELVKPVHERLTRQRDEVEESVNKVEEGTVEGVKEKAWRRVERAMGFIREGQVVPPVFTADGKSIKNIPTFEGVEHFESPVALPPYPGMWYIWSWASEVRDTLLRSMEAEVRAAEEEARGETVEGVKEVMQGLAKKFLPDEEKKGNERVFRPEVMFAKRRAATKGKFSGGTAGVGLRASEAANGSMEVSVLDLFDLERLVSFNKKSAASTSSSKEEEGDASTLSVVSLGVGAITMFGSRAVGVRGFVEAIARACDILGSKEARKWAGPVIGVLSEFYFILYVAESLSLIFVPSAALGVAVYVVLDLPRAVPRNIGRKLHVSLDSPSSSTAVTAPSQQPTTYATSQSERISRETRKVLRLAGWDLRERFRAALEKSERERREVEGNKEKAEGAIKWLEGFLEQVEKEDEKVTGVDLEGKAIEA